MGGKDAKDYVKSQRRCIGGIWVMVWCVGQEYGSSDRVKYGQYLYAISTALEIKDTILTLSVMNQPLEA